VRLISPASGGSVRSTRIIPARDLSGKAVFPAVAVVLFAAGCCFTPRTDLWDVPPTVSGSFVAANPEAPRKDIFEVLALPDNQIDVVEAAMLLARDTVRRETAGSNQAEDLLECAVDRVLAGRNALDYREDRLEEFDIELLAKGEAGSCLGVSLLFLGVARRLGLPVYGVAVPGHFFLRFYCPGGRRRNLDVTRPNEELNDEFYIRWRKISDRTLRTGLYMRSLTDREVLAHLLASRSGCLARAGMYELALRDAETALRELPGNPQALINRGFVLDRMGKEAQAAESYRMAIRANPGASRALNNLAHILCRSPASPLYNPMKARDLALEAIRLEPSDADYYVTAADAYAAMKQWRQAVRMMGEAVRLAPGNAKYEAKFLELRETLRDEVRAGREGPHGFRLPPNPMGR
jgi:regulator of sirC expression with transglutaminase-like and TPR domain